MSICITSLRYLLYRITMRQSSVLIKFFYFFQKK
nr:MAG TPA: hypothetical protein [Caudoviricetes sp.]